jgi:hypothetical protein
MAQPAGGPSVDHGRVSLLADVLQLGGHPTAACECQETEQYCPGAPAGTLPRQVRPRGCWPSGMLHGGWWSAAADSARPRPYAVALCLAMPASRGTLAARQHAPAFWDQPTACLGCGCWRGASPPPPPLPATEQHSYGVQQTSTANNPMPAALCSARQRACVSSDT